MTSLKEMAVDRILSLFRQWRQPHILLPLYGIAVTFGALLALFLVLGSQSESRESFFLGYSLERTLFGIGLILLTLVLIYLTLRFIRYPEWSRHVWGLVVGRKAVGNMLLWVSAAIFLLCWMGLFFPSYRISGNLSEHIVRLQPVIIWVAAVSFATILILLFERKVESVGSIIFTNKTAVQMGAIILAVCLLTWVLIALTGIGVRQREDYWYGPGVPVLGLQVLFSMVLGGFVLWLESGREIKNVSKLDVFVCIVIWALTAWLWAHEPLRPNYFLPDTAKNIIYPYSDSATFDIGSQFALIGQGLFNGQYFDRAVYSAFMTYLHLVAGQNTEQLMVAQVVVYAVFPVIVYLLGRELHSRALGVSAAILILLRGVNSISAATWIDLAGPKMMLTDFPTAIGIALFVLFVLKWMNEPSKMYFAVLAGGMLGMTIMLRTHVLLLMPVLIIYILFLGVRLRWNYRVLGSFLLILGMVTATLPWDMRNLSNGTPMFYVYYYRIQVILQERYEIREDAYRPAPSLLVSGIQDSHAQIVHRDILRQRIINSPAITFCDSQLCSIVNHFFHNLITSVLFLPTSFVFDSLWNTVKEGASHWKQNWVGEGLGANESLLILINLAVVSLGIGVAWERARFVGLLPAVFFLTYIFSNALAFTSGGRYIVPVDWIVCIYFVLGILHIIFWLLCLAGVISSHKPFQVENKAESHDPRPIQYSRMVLALVIVFMIGSLVPIAETPFQRRYQINSSEETLAILEQQGLLEQTNLTHNDLSEFLSYPQAEIIIGRALYPRYYRSGEGEPKRTYPYMLQDYARLAFLTIGPYGTGVENVVIPGGRPRFDLHSEDVIVIGCKNNQFLDALVVIVTAKPESVYLRSPQSVLQCPLQPPE